MAAKLKTALTWALLVGCLPSFPMAAIAQDAATLTVVHSQGESQVPLDPKTVVVFDLASLDTLDALGVTIAGVPAGPKPAALARYAGDDYAKVGTLFEPDYEAVNAADPDLIVVGGRSSPKYANLADLAPTIDLTTDATDFLASSRRNAETLGRIFGRQALVADRLAKLDSAIARLKSQTATAGRGLIVLTTGGKMSAYGAGSRFGVLYDEFGMTPATDAIAPSNHGQSISFEFIAKTDPDWLFVLDRDAAIGAESEAAAQLLDNELVRGTKAWKSGHVVHLDSANWYLAAGGLSSMQAIVDQISAALAKA